LGLGYNMAWRLTTTGETDFILSEACMDATHILITNMDDSSNLPELLVEHIIKDRHGETGKPDGYITSKHAMTAPHRVLNEKNNMWPVYLRDNTLYICVASPPTVSPKTNRNEWLFNYPPARDIAMHFKHAEHLSTLSTFALDSLFKDPPSEPNTECVFVSADEFGTDDAPQTLQAVWAWASPQVFSLCTDETESGAFIMRNEQPSNSDSFPIEPADFQNMCDLLREHGFSILHGTADDAQSVYMGMASEALERINDLVDSAELEKRKQRYSGGMFQ